jgi:hypothetical protein
MQIPPRALGQVDFAGFPVEIYASSTVVSHISRKTSEIWGTRPSVAGTVSLIFQLTTASRQLGGPKRAVGFPAALVHGTPG